MFHVKSCVRTVLFSHKIELSSVNFPKQPIYSLHASEESKNCFKKITQANMYSHKNREWNSVAAIIWICLFSRTRIRKTGPDPWVEQAGIGRLTCFPSHLCVTRVTFRYPAKRNFVPETGEDSLQVAAVNQCALPQLEGSLENTVVTSRGRTTYIWPSNFRKTDRGIATRQL